MVIGMGYPFEDLDDSQFERLVVQCARKLFGMGVISFAAGVDGGRDARFTGIAERYPSSTGPWSGKTIIQAKHTNYTNAHVSDANFSGDSDSSVLSIEVLRIKKLAESGDLDNYILFTNRRLGANAALGFGHGSERARTLPETPRTSHRREILGRNRVDGRGAR